MVTQFTVDFLRELSAKDANDAKEKLFCEGTPVNRFQGRVRLPAPSSQRTLGSILTLLFVSKAKIKMDPSLRWDDEQNSRLPSSLFLFTSFASFASCFMHPAAGYLGEIGNRQEERS